MIRDIQEEDVDFYVTDELQKRLLIKDYHPIFQLQVSQFSDVNDEVKPEEPYEEHKITIVTDKIIRSNIEQTITINVEDFGGVKYKKQGDNYIALDSNIIRGYYFNQRFFSDYEHTVEIPKDNSTIFVDNDTQYQYILINNIFARVMNLIPGQLQDGNFIPFFTNYDEYPEIVATINPMEEEMEDDNDILDDEDNSEDNVDEDDSFEDNADEEDLDDYEEDDIELDDILINSTLTEQEDEEVEAIDIREQYLNPDYEDEPFSTDVPDPTVPKTNLFIVYENTIQLAIKDFNNKTLHKALFPHLAYGSIEYKCIFTTPGFYTIKVTLLNENNIEPIKEQSFDIKVIEEDEKNYEIVEINNITEDDETNLEPLYLPNKIGNRIINPRINEKTNLKCSLNTLMLDNIYYIKDLLNSNRSNILFTSPTNKEYQIYQYESHNIYNENGEIEDTWFYINADFIDEYIELHILPTYINTMDNIILLSDNDIIDYLLYPTSDTESTTDTEESETTSDTESNTNTEEEYKETILTKTFIENNTQEYKIECIDEQDFAIALVPICLEPQWFDLTEYLPENYSNYKISFDCYSSYYYRSIFYINDIQIYQENNNVYIEHDNIIDIIPYNLLDKGEHNIEFSIDDDNEIRLGIDNYIISTDIFDTISPPSDLKIGFQQVKLNNPVTEVLATDDIDSYTYITNLIYENTDYKKDIDVTIKEIPLQDNQEMPIHFPLGIYRDLLRLEIDVVKKGTNPYIFGVVDKTNVEPYDRTTLLDYNISYTHSPIQYKNDDEKVTVKDGINITLNIEEINDFDDIKVIPNKLGTDTTYEYIADEQQNIIQTLKYFNDDLYSEAYVQTSSSMSDSLSLFTNKQFYMQNWLEKESSKANIYYEVNFND